MLDWNRRLPHHGFPPLSPRFSGRRATPTARCPYAIYQSTPFDANLRAHFGDMSSERSAKFLYESRGFLV